MFTTRLDSPYKTPLESQFPGQSGQESTYTVTLDGNSHTVYVRYVGAVPTQQEVEARVLPPADTIENRLGNWAGNGKTLAALILTAPQNAGLFAQLTAQQKQRVNALIGNAGTDIVALIQGAS